MVKRKSRIDEKIKLKNEKAVRSLYIWGGFFLFIVAIFFGVFIVNLDKPEEDTEDIPKELVDKLDEINTDNDKLNNELGEFFDTIIAGVFVWKILKHGAI